jgi:hypothetical protein
MEFQQGTTLLVAAVSSMLGAAVSYGIMKEQVTNLKDTVREIKLGVVYKDTCGQCQNKWAASNMNFKDDIAAMSIKLDQVLLLMSGLAKNTNGRD